jgi:hypothetical protein
MTAFGLILGYLICAFLAYGLFYGHFRKVASYPDDEPHDHSGAVWLSVWGPLSLMLALFLSAGTWGFKIKRDRP